MSSHANYAILGRGRWAGRMSAILSGENRRVTQVPETRQVEGESGEAYASRVAHALRASDAQIAWLCVLPGPHIPPMIEAALDAGMHVIAEKPWLSSRLLTDALIAKAKSLHRVVAVHFEYCMLEEVERWRRDFGTAAGLRFGGRFFLNRADHTGMSALDNLGSHLLAIREYAAPNASIQEIRCGYEQPDERCAWLEKRNTRAAFLDLLANKEPIIQRFVSRVEAALEGEEFELDLKFALRVAQQSSALS